METNTQEWMENITQESIQILKTALLLERNYSVSYLVRIVQADDRYEFRKPLHKELETYGTLEGLPSSRIEDITHYLIEQGMLRVNNRLYGTIDITDQGRDYLSDPSDIEASRQDVYRGWDGVQLSIALRNMRREVAEQSGKPPYEVFTNFVLSLIVRRMPATEEELRRIDGMRNLSATVKARILKETIQILNLKQRNDATGGSLQKAFSPGHRKIKDLFEGGFGVDEIARRRGVKSATIRQALAELHEAGMLDLKPWIEREVDSLTLHKGAEYFRSTHSPRIDEARQVLGYDYDILHLCRAYTSQVQEPAPVYH